MGAYVYPDLNHHERYAEMCAVFTTGSLTEDELRELKKHLGQCEPCRRLLSEYRQVVREAIPLAIEDVSRESSSMLHSRAPYHGRGDVVSRIAEQDQVAAVIRPSRRVGGGAAGLWCSLRNLDLGRAVAFVIAGAVLVGAGYFVRGKKEQGFQTAPPHHAQFESERTAELAALNRHSLELEAQTKERSKKIQELGEQISVWTKEIAQLKRLADEVVKDKDVAVSKADALLTENHELSGDRETTSRKMEEAQASVLAVQQQLAQLNAQREDDLLQSASLQAEIAALSAEVKANGSTIAEQQKMLASDRDIRELMGARELYIADVFDVDNDGKTEKPFGRVFYTEHKSLIFYAFDLDQQRGVRNASTFQAWGLREADKEHPLSMGIFYQDNEVNRRWVLKFEDPRVLEQIQAVFVTVEPKGGSHKPSGKQLLFASLRTAPNHP
jgi:DNA repair exonuclease SbcCD ATPase subunit